MDATVEQRRPTSVVLFEALNVFAALSIMLLWEEGGPFRELAEFLVMVGLTLWVTRGRSRIGRLAYTGVWLIGAAGAIAALAGGHLLPGSPMVLLVLAVFAIELIVFITLLWWPSTSDWLRAADAPSA